jgi:hypothetical protein
LLQGFATEFDDLCHTLPTGTTGSAAGSTARRELSEKMRLALFDLVCSPVPSRSSSAHKSVLGYVLGSCIRRYNYDHAH